MKKYIVLMFLALTVAGYSQPKFHVEGKKLTYDTTGTFAQTTLVGALGPMKYVGTIDMRLPDGYAQADSFAVEGSFSDSVQVALVIRPRTVYVTPAIQDTTGRVTPAASHLWHIQNGAGHVVFPWYRIKALALTDLTNGITKYDVFLRINKVAGLFTYGKTTGEIKAAGTVVLKPVLYK